MAERPPLMTESERAELRRQQLCGLEGLIKEAAKHCRIYVEDEEAARAHFEKATKERERAMAELFVLTERWALAQGTEDEPTSTRE